AKFGGANSSSIELGVKTRKVKRSYSQKSEDCSRRPIENQRPNRAAGWPRNDVPRSAKTYHPLSRPKSTGRSPHDPGNMSRGRPPPHATPHDRAARAGKQSLAAAQPMYRAESVRPGSIVPSGRRFIGQFHPSDHTADTKIRPRPFRLEPHDPTVRPTVPTDRPNAAVDPKPFLKPNPHNSSPKPAPT
ncbi:unnamed protein product, partial [Microthlaspi erraticum]